MEAIIDDWISKKCENLDIHFNLCIILIPTGSNIVCQEEEIKDKLKQEQKGYHQYLLVKEDLREYHSYNNMVESGYFETFIWERNVGLKYYKSGYGAELSLVELELLNDDDKWEESHTIHALS